MIFVQEQRELTDGAEVREEEQRINALRSLGRVPAEIGEPAVHAGVDLPLVRWLQRD